MPRPWRALGVIVLVAVSFPRPSAGEDQAAPAPPATVPAAADAIVRLAEARDEAGLGRLASALPLDPWIVADELCARGACDAAELYARAAPASRRGGLLAT